MMGFRAGRSVAYASVLLAMGFSVSARIGGSPALRGQEATGSGGIAIDELIEIAKSHVGRFAPPKRDDVVRKQRIARDAAKALDQFLARGGPSVRRGWHVYLEWEVIAKELAEEQPNLERLNGALQKLYSDVNGVEKPAYRTFRAALHDFMNAAAVANTAAIAEQHDKQLEAIIAALTDYRTTSSAESALAIGRGLGWLADTGQAPELVRRYREVLARPNLLTSVSARFIRAGADESVDESIPITDEILGTSIVGVARTIGRVKVDLVPNAEKAELEIHLDGTAYSDNTGTNRGVVIHSSGTTRIAASKRISVDSEGIHDAPAKAVCATSSVITGICHRLRLVRKIAWRKAGQQQGDAESIANGKAESRVRRQVDERVASMLSEAREQFIQRFRNPLLRKNEFPQRFELSTTADRLDVTLLQANAFQLGSVSEPPPIGTGFDLAVRLHESFAGNFSEATIGGVKLTDERLVRILEENKREVPEELRIDPTKDPWSITFPRSQPVRLEVRDQTLKVVIRGREFSRGEQVVASEMDIWAVYRLERTPQGARLTRDGEVQAEYTRGGFENAAKIAVKTLMRKKFDALFKSQLDGQGLQLGGRYDKVGPLKLGHLDANAGWISLGWTLPPDPASTAAN